MNVRLVSKDSWSVHDRFYERSFNEAPILSKNYVFWRDLDENVIDLHS